jgi:hypothetical protein
VPAAAHHSDLLHRRLYIGERAIGTAKSLIIPAAELQLTLCGRTCPVRVIRAILPHFPHVRLSTDRVENSDREKFSR